MVDRLVLVCAWRTTATPRSYSPGGVSQMNKLVMGLGHLQGEIDDSSAGIEEKGVCFC